MLRDMAEGKIFIIGSQDIAACKLKQLRELIKKGTGILPFVFTFSSGDKPGILI
jgi:hypothetical protein